MVLEELCIHIQKNEVGSLPHIRYKNNLKTELWQEIKQTKQFLSWCVSVKVTQSYPILCDPKDCSLLASSVRRILQAEIYWSGFPFCSPGDLPDPVIKSRSLALQADSFPSEPPGKPISNGRDRHKRKWSIFTCGLFCKGKTHLRYKHI